VNNMGFVGALKLALLCVLLCAAASAGVGAAASPKGIRSVGIVSAVGDKFYVRKVGLMAFGNDTKEFPIDSWRVDDLVVSKTRGLLSKSYDVRAVTYRRAAIAAAPISRSGLGDTLRAEVSPQGLDAYLVVTKVAVQYGGTNQSISGLGIVEGPFDHYFIYAILRIVLVDGRELLDDRAKRRRAAGRQAVQFDNNEAIHLRSESRSR
jgi:hypothetical protein